MLLRLLAAALLPALPIHAQQRDAAKRALDLAAFLVSTEESQVEAESRPAAGQGADPGAMAAVSGPPQILRWWDNRTLEGNLTAVGPGELHWQHASFARAARIGTTGIYDITSPSKPMQLPGNIFLATLENGDRIFGELDKLDHEHIVLRSPVLGQAQLRHAMLLRVDRITGEDILWAGPRGIDNWRINSHDDKDPRSRAAVTWIETDNGALKSISTQGGISLPLAASTNELEITLSLSATSAPPRFAIHLESPGTNDITLCTWDNLLVLRQDDRFTMLHTLGEDQRSIDLRLLRSPDADGRGCILGPDGTVLARWSGEASNPAPASRPVSRPLASITIENHGADLLLERLRIRELAASRDEEARDQPTQGTEQSNGSGWLVEFAGSAPVICPALPVITGNHVTCTTRDGHQLRHPLTSLLSLAATGPPPPAPDPAAVRARLQDNSIIRGSLVPDEDAPHPGSIRISTPHSAEPLIFSADFLRRLTWLEKPPESPANTAPLDTLQIDETTLHGHWAKQDGRGIRWLPPGGLEAVELAIDATANFSLERGIADNFAAPAPTALVHLDDGQIIPGQIAAITGAGMVKLDDGIFEALELSRDLVSAILFPGRKVVTTGFSDPGWRFTSGQEDSEAFQDTDGGGVLIDPRHSWGHPSILVGKELSFNINRISGHGGIKIGLFGNGVDHRDPATYLLIANWGNRVYHGIAAPEGDFSGRYTQTVIPGDGPARIDITWEADHLNYFINDLRAGTIPFDPDDAPRSGFGLLFESCTIWGNNPGQCRLSGFSLVPSHGESWTPAINKEARDRALFVPRFRREDPPRHVLLAANGDLLSGVIESINHSHVMFRSRLETIDIPRDRITAAIWIKPPEADSSSLSDAGSPGSSGHARPSGPAAGFRPFPSENTGNHCWISLYGGGLFAMQLDGFDNGFAIGRSTQLGECRVPVERIHAIHRNQPSPSPSSGILSGWRLQPAPEPQPQGAIASFASDSPLIGKTAPDIRLPLLEGEEFVLSRERGKVVVLDFWASWCAPCVEGMPELLEAFKDFSEHEIVVVAANQAEAPAAVDRFVRDRGWHESPRLVVALDPEQAAAARYEFESIPFTVLIDTDGKVAAVISGFRPGNADKLAERARQIISEAIRIN